MILSKELESNRATDMVHHKMEEQLIGRKNRIEYLESILHVELIWARTEAQLEVAATPSWALQKQKAIDAETKPRNCFCIKVLSKS